MSVRAYNRRPQEIIIVKTGEKKTEYLAEENPSFNLWHNNCLMDAIEHCSGFYSGLNDDGCGIGTIQLEDFEEIKKYLKKNKHYKEEEDAIKNIERDFKETDEEWVEYECY
jgi:hypothetical protein